MSGLSEEYVVRFLKDDEYELIDRFNNEVVMQGSLSEINAWLDLHEKGLVG